jgi:hypothetical protein
MSKSDEHVLASIKRWVWSGYYSADDINRMIDDILDASCDENALRGAIEPELATKIAAEKNWPVVTDCDKLDAVFYRLHERGICALGNTGYEMSDGYPEVAEVVANAPAKHYHGYCFYHGQDVEGALAGHGLWIAFGALDDDERRGVAVGSAVAEVLRQAGFDVAWDGSISTRISIPKFSWQRRAKRSE